MDLEAAQRAIIQELNPEALVEKPPPEKKPYVRRERFSRLPWRPYVDPEKRRGVVGGRKSNKRYPGEKSLRNEFSATERLAIIKDAEDSRGQFSSEEEWIAKMAKAAGLKQKKLKQFIANKAKDEEFVKREKIGVGARGSKGVQPREFSLRASKSLGFRAPGGGRKNLLTPCYGRLKAWLEESRSQGHRISSNHVFTQLQRIIIVEAKNSSDKQYASELQRRLQSWAASDGYRKTATREALKKIGGRVHLPNRISELPFWQERLRTHLTWKSFDAALWKAAFYTLDELKSEGQISNAVQFLEARHNLVIAFTDQIPFWVKIGSAAQVYAESEMKVQLGKRLRKKVAHQASQIQAVELEEEFQDVNREKASYKTQKGDSKQDKFRVTYEPFLVMLDYFSEDIQQDSINKVLP